jgi:hypothetical protein
VDRGYLAVGEGAAVDGETAENSVEPIGEDAAVRDELFIDVLGAQNRADREIRAVRASVEDPAS